VALRFVVYAKSERGFQILNLNGISIGSAVSAGLTTATDRQTTTRSVTMGRINVRSKGKGKGKGFPYSTPSIGPGADPGVQAVSPQMTVSHIPGGRLPLLSARPAVTSPAAEHHRPLAGTKLNCLVTEAHRCKQLAQGCYAALPREVFEPATY